MDGFIRLRLMALLVDHLRNLEALKGLYEKTANPLFIWDAIAVTNAIRDLGDRGIEVPELPTVPHWAAAYISQTAINLSKLAAEADLATKSPIASLAHALDLVPKLGSTRFVEYRRMRRDLDAADEASRLKAEGRTTFEIDEALRKRFGDKEGSVIRKRVTSGKRLREQIDQLLTKASIK